jgi:hypothetical protein
VHAVHGRGPYVTGAVTAEQHDAALGQQWYGVDVETRARRVEVPGTEFPAAAVVSGAQQHRITLADRHIEAVRPS